MGEAVGTVLARIAADPAPLTERASALLAALRPAVPYDAAWLAVADTRLNRYLSLASVDLDEELLGLLEESATAPDATTGADRDGPVRSGADVSFPADQLPAWEDHLSQAGLHESLTVALLAPGQRQVGSLVLFSRSASPPPRTVRRRLAGLAPVLALGIDPMPALLAVARVVPGVTAGRLLRDDGLTEPLGELPGSPLLAVGSSVLAVACRRLGGRFGSTSSFLWPLGGWHAPDGHVRVTVVNAPEDAPAFLIGEVLLSPSPELHDLTPREVEVLGLVVEGCSNQEIAHTLVVAPRTVAAHLEHVLAKLDVSTRTLAAVRAERAGLYVPVVPGSSWDPACGERAR